jgi:hypothetical protein
MGAKMCFWQGYPSFIAAPASLTPAPALNDLGYKNLSTTTLNDFSPYN